MRGLVCLVIAMGLLFGCVAKGKYQALQEENRNLKVDLVKSEEQHHTTMAMLAAADGLIRTLVAEKSIRKIPVRPAKQTPSVARTLPPQVPVFDYTKPIVSKEPIATNMPAPSLSDIIGPAWWCFTTDDDAPCFTTSDECKGRSKVAAKANFQVDPFRCSPQEYASCFSAVDKLQKETRIFCSALVTTCLEQRKSLKRYSADFGSFSQCKGITRSTVK